MPDGLQQRGVQVMYVRPIFLCRAERNKTSANFRFGRGRARVQEIETAALVGLRDVVGRRDSRLTL
ncbi:MAG: hypothetical protein ACREEM_56405, partial [Blastocatellia bacterium]